MTGLCFCSSRTTAEAGYKSWLTKLPCHCSKLIVYTSLLQGPPYPSNPGICESGSASQSPYSFLASITAPYSCALVASRPVWAFSMVPSGDFVLHTVCLLAWRASLTYAHLRQSHDDRMESPASGQRRPHQTTW